MGTASTLLRVSKKAGSCLRMGRGTSSNPKTELMDMPVEIVLRIANNMHHMDQVLLSLTCTAMRNILQPSAGYVTRNRTRYLRYLAAVCRDMPDYWLCEFCATLHSMSPEDTIRRPVILNCPRADLWQRSGRYVSHSIYGYKLGHRHVQLALKYSRQARLTKQQRNYLKTLTATLEDTDFAFRPVTPSEFTYTATVYGIAPRIAEGRFIVRTKICFEGAFCRRSLGWVYLCEHDSVWELRRFDDFGWRDAYGRHAVRETTGSLGTALSLAYQFPKLPIPGACDKCPLDFEVCWTGKRLELRGWYDFGPEGLTKHKPWAALTQMTYADDGIRGLNVKMRHPAGSIRERYKWAV